MVSEKDGLDLPEVGMTLSMTELYEGVTFPRASGETRTAWRSPITASQVDADSAPPR